MNKKFVALLSVVGISAVLTGCSSNMKVDNFRNNISDFKQNITEYCKLNSKKANKTIFNKYKLALNVPNATLVDSDKVETLIDPIAENKTEIEPESDANSNLNQLEEQNKTQISTKEENVDDISTLYSLSCDIDGECENFTTLKNKLNDAILETQNLIDKVNKKEIELTAEQRMLITEQSQQLKSLGRKLSHVTTELSLNLSDLANLMRENGDLDNISLKYLVVLDNLVNGNEMLENGLQSLNLMNGMFNIFRQLPPNNGRIVYGFRKNNEPPVIRDYSINEKGEITENKPDEKNTDEQSETEKSNTKLKSNIDTYNNGFSNIDSFFNTALLDNEFMYGNNRFGGGYGPMMGYGGGFNPYYENQYADKNEQLAKENKTTNSVDNENNTQHNDVVDNSTKTGDSQKKKGFIKNIDTYKKDNSTSLSTKINNFKSKVSNAFSKFSIPKDKLSRPIHKYEKDD